jgi:hypothetical protein
MAERASKPSEGLRHEVTQAGQGEKNYRVKCFPYEPGKGFAGWLLVHGTNLNRVTPAVSRAADGERIAGSWWVAHGADRAVDFVVFLRIRACGGAIDANPITKGLAFSCPVNRSSLTSTAPHAGGSLAW